MSVHWLRTKARSLLLELVPSADVVAVLEAPLEAADPALSGLICALGQGAGLNEQEVSLRGAALLLQHCSIQVADDIADGELGRLVESEKLGPAAQSLLQVAALGALVRSQVSRPAITEFCADLMSVGAEHILEFRASSADAALAARLAEGLNGAQYRAFFRVLLDGTLYEADAPEAGFLFGCVLHVAGDRLSRDRRWLGLSRDDQKELLRFAQGALDRLSKLRLPDIESHLQWFQGVLSTPLP